MTTPTTPQEKRLVFGDPESIKLRDSAIEDNIIKKLKAVVKCPFCKSDVDDCYDFNMGEKRIGWNFKCEATCPNSIDYGEQNGYEESRTYTNFNGKFYNN